MKTLNDYTGQQLRQLRLQWKVDCREGSPDFVPFHEYLKTAGLREPYAQAFQTEDFDTKQQRQADEYLAGCAAADFDEQREKAVNRLLANERTYSPAMLIVTLVAGNVGLFMVGAVFALSIIFPADVLFENAVRFWQGVL